MRTVFVAPDSAVQLSTHSAPDDLWAMPRLELRVQADRQPGVRLVFIGPTVLQFLDAAVHTLLAESRALQPLRLRQPDRPSSAPARPRSRPTPLPF